MSHKVQITLEDTDIERVIQPYISHQFASEDPQLKMLLRKLRWKWRIKRVTQSLRRARHRNRSQKNVQAHYEQVWGDFSFSDLLPCGRKEYLIRWGATYYMAQPHAIARVHLLCLEKIIAALQPASILEIGFGTGRMLVALSARFPEIHFSGIELSSRGIEQARWLSRQRELPRELVDYIPFDLPEYTMPGCLDLRQGSAAQLPFSEASVDLVYTRQALEQMETTRDQVLNEITRVSRGHVAMFEAFRDWNARGMCRNRIVAKNYFAAFISDLAKYGVDPVYTRADFPGKSYMHVGLVLATSPVSENSP